MKTIQIISGIISLFFGIFGLVFIIILPLTGIHFDYNINGTSMEPTLKNEVTIRLSPKLAPFEDLQVGDIILFRQIDYQGPGIVYVPEWNEDHTKFHLTRQTELAEDPQKYKLIQHRIIAINENSLVTKGDNNEYPDFQPVKPKEYQGKIIWHLNHINWLFKAMYRYGLFLGCVILYYVLSFFPKNAKVSNVHPNNSQNDSALCKDCKSRKDDKY